MPNDNTILLIIIVIIVLFSFYLYWSLGIALALTLLLVCYLNYTSNGFFERHVLTSKVRSSVAQITRSFLRAFRNIEWDNFRFGEMFSQSSWDNSYSSRNTNGSVVNRSAEKRGNLTFSLDPRKHSTPLSQKSTSWNSFASKNNITPVKSLRLRRPEKYALSDTSIYSTPSSPERTSPRAVQNSAGPLLASTRYNLGLYADVKSPGLTSRLVKYSEDANREPSRTRLTHNPKYAGPGIFPNVNLSKPSQLPIKPLKRNSIVRIASPDTSSVIGLDKNSFVNNYSLPQCQVNQQSPTASATDISTRSVLDALKEISRKRIHAKDDNLSDRLKRQRKDIFFNNIPESPITSKRIREQEIQTDESYTASLSPSYKKQKNCTEDIYSSLSSSICLKENASSKRKAELIPLNTIDKTKQIKLRPNSSSPPVRIVSNVKISPKTPTVEKQKQSPPIENVVELEIPDEPDTSIKTNEGSIVNENGVCRLTFVSNPPAKSKDVFVPFKPTSEESKRKRLVALLGALSGEDTGVKSLTEKFFPSENKPPTNSIDTTDSSDKSQPGILSSPKNKDATKKHVTFDIPENSSNASSIPSEPLPSYSSSISTLANKENIGLVSSPSVTPSSNVSSSSIENSQAKTSSSNLGLTFTPASSQHNTPQTVSTFSFGADKPISSPNTSGNYNVTAIQSPIVSTITSSPNTNAIPKINFNPSSQEAPKPLGGFKFDLAPASTTNSSFNSSTISFNATTTTSTITSNTSFATPKSTSFSSPVSTTPNFGFGNHTTSANISFGTSVPSTTSNMTFGNITATSSINFGQPISSSSTSSPFGNPASYSSSNISFGGNPASSTSTVNSFGNSTTKANVSFGNSTNVSTTASFGSPAPAGFGNATPKVNFENSTAVTTSSVTFGTPTTTTSSFTPAINFNATKPTPQQSSNMFAGTMKPTTGFSPSFGTVVSKQSENPSSNAVPSFGASVTKSETSSTFAFTATTKSFENKPAPSFASPFNSSPFNKAESSSVGSNNAAGFSFGNANSQANPSKPFSFNATTNNVFGSSPTTTATSNIFGSTPITTSSTTGFGNSTFGNQAPSFGGFGTTQPTNSSFGVNNVTKPESNPFGNAQTTAFDSGNKANIFGAATAAPTFGSPVTTQSFGSTTTNTFQAPQNSTNPASNIFTFGGAPPNVTAPSAAQPFQFGGAPKPVSGGFNFSANSTNTFNSSGGNSFGNGPAVQFGAAPNPGGNMFNIGTGSTAARARNPAMRSRKK